MKKRSVLRAAAFLCALAVLAVSASFPTASAEQSETVFYVRSDVSSDYVSLGDVITFSVDVSDCPGIAAGSLCASASSSVDFVSATFCGEDVPADLASGPNAGARVIDILDPDTDKKGFISDFCTFTYRVTGLDDVSFEFYTYECIVSEYTELVHSVSPSGPLVYHVAVPEKPVIKTASPLPKGAVGIAYSCPLESDGETEFTEWDLVSGSLPEGIELLNTGELSGTPSVFGVFSFSVTASVLGSVTSDPAEFELEILEKPAELVLVQGSTYAFESGEDVKYLIGVKEQTDVSAVISYFETPEYVSVFDAEGNVKSPTDTVGTGYTVRLMDGQNVMDSVTVVVLGDVSGDGRIATIDYQRIRAYYLGNYEMDGAYLRAAHVAGNPRVATIDYQRVRAHYLGTYDIFA